MAICTIFKTLYYFQKVMLKRLYTVNNSSAQRLLRKFASRIQIAKRRNNTIKLEITMIFNCDSRLSLKLTTPFLMRTFDSLTSLIQLS
jgi:hypothetical protein